MQRAGDARAAQRLLRAIFLARRHQARHLGFGDGDFLAAPFGQANILDDVIGGGGVFGLVDVLMTILGQEGFWGAPIGQSAA